MREHGGRAMGVLILFFLRVSLSYVGKLFLDMGREGRLYIALK